MTIRTARFRLTLAAIALTILSPALAAATSFSWTSTGGEFDTAGNWTQSGAPVDFDGIPDASDIVIFDRGNVTLYPVFFGDLLVPNSDIHPTVDKVVIGTNPLSFAGFHGSTLTADSTNITETGRGVVIGSGAGDVAALTSTLATFDTQYATLGSAAGSSGTLNLTSLSAGAFSVSGTGATYDLIVGLNGTGTINVTNGRDVTVADDTVLGQDATGVGNVTVSGAGSTWTNTGDFNVGLSGIGALNVSGGGQISDASGYLASTNGLTSTATISGAGSTWTNSIALIVANHGMATLEVSSGAQVTSSNSGYVGYFADAQGSATITGTGSTWTNSLSTIAGSSGQGSLTISAGGLVSDTFGVVGGVAGSVGTATVSGTDSRWTNSNNLIVGDGGNGTLDILAGGEVTSASGYIGDDANSLGDVTVDGMGSRWTNTGLSVGNAGSGTMNVTGGGEVSSVTGYIGNDVGSIGTVLVAGAGSNWTTTNDLYVGKAGNGALSIIDGGHVASDDLIVSDTGNGTLNVGNGGQLSITAAVDVEVVVAIGNAVNSDGTVIVNGSGSSWIVSKPREGADILFAVGNAGTGTLEVTNGGDVTITRTNENVFALSSSETKVDIGKLTGSSGRVTVDGVGSTWTIDTSSFDSVFPLLNIGASGNGSLDITNGGMVIVSQWDNSATSVIGSAASTTGDVVVDGAGSRWTIDGYLYVGGLGNGTLDITNGGFVLSAFGVIGRNNGSNGSVTINGFGSLWRNYELEVGSEGTGTLTITNQGAVEADKVFIRSLGEIRGDGRIVERLDGVQVENGGLVSPGTSIGALTIDGDYFQYERLVANPNFGELLIQLASASSYDRLLITGNATLAGTLTVSLIDGFTPSIGQTFTILTANDVGSTFSAEVFPSVPNLGFDVIYNAQSVVLTVLSALPGDYNGNGTVDAADYTLWRDNLGGSSLPNESASLGIVDEMDYDFWKLHFGDTVGSGSGDAGSAGAAVPEPTSFAWMMAAMCGMILAARRPSGRRQRCPFYRLRLIVN